MSRRTIHHRFSSDIARDVNIALSSHDDDRMFFGTDSYLGRTPEEPRYDIVIEMKDVDPRYVDRLVEWFRSQYDRPQGADPAPQAFPPADASPRLPGPPKALPRSEIIAEFSDDVDTEDD